MSMPPFRISFPETTVVAWDHLKPRRGARPKCRVSGCSSRLYARGMCSLHYNRMRHSKDSLVEPRRASREPGQKCAVNGCSTKCEVTDLCQAHYSEVFILASNEKVSWDAARLRLIPARMDTGELRIDCLRRRAKALQQKRAKKKREFQKYEHLANVVNENDTDWGEERDYYE